MAGFCAGVLYGDDYFIAGFLYFVTAKREAYRGFEEPVVGCPYSYFIDITQFGNIACSR